jgi:hypothetical protein
MGMHFLEVQHGASAVLSLFGYQKTQVDLQVVNQLPRKNLGRLRRQEPPPYQIGISLGARGLIARAHLDPGPLKLLSCHIGEI